MNEYVPDRMNPNAQRSPYEAVVDPEQLINAAIADGKFPPSRAQHYREAFASDRDGTAALVATLAPGLASDPEPEKELPPWMIPHAA